MNKQNLTKKTLLSMAVASTAISPVIYAYEIGSSFDDADEDFLSINLEPILNDGGGLDLNDIDADTGLDRHHPDRRTWINRTKDLATIHEDGFAVSEHMGRNIVDQYNSSSVFKQGESKFTNSSQVISMTLGPDAVANNIDLIEKTQKQPLVFANYDPANALGTIAIISSHRNSDGSADLTYKYVGPNYFERKSDGGQLSDKEYNSMVGAIGDNPASGNIPSDSTYSHVFANVSEMGMMTFAGIIMQQQGSTLGYYTKYNPDIRQWTTKSGNAFKKKITQHVEASLDPDMKILVPRDNFKGGITPFFTHENGNLVNSGITALSTANYGSSLELGKFILHYENKTESGWTGLAIALVAGALVATGVGAAALAGVSFGGLGGATAIIAGSATAGAVGAHSLVNGTLNDPVSNGLLHVSATTNHDSFGVSSEFGNRWKNFARTKISNGVFNPEPVHEEGEHDLVAAYNRKLVTDDSDHSNAQWAKLVDPEFETRIENNTIKHTSPVDEDTMFDNKYDNPDYGKRFRTYRISYGCSDYGGSCGSR